MMFLRSTYFHHVLKSHVNSRKTVLRPVSFVHKVSPSHTAENTPRVEFLTRICFRSPGAISTDPAVFDFFADFRRQFFL